MEERKEKQSKEEKRNWERKWEKGEDKWEERKIEERKWERNGWIVAGDYTKGEIIRNEWREEMTAEVRKGEYCDGWQEFNLI